MSVILSPELTTSEVWLKIKTYSEKEMAKLGLREHVVNIRTATQEESGVIVGYDESVCVQYDPGKQTMDLILHKSIADPAGLIALDGPKTFAKVIIVDTLLQITTPDE